VLFETLHGGSAIRFLGSVYATAQIIFNMTKEADQGSGSSERMGGYDQFIYLLFCVLEIIYVSYIHLCCFIFTNGFILSVLSYYNMIDLSVLILQSCLSGTIIRGTLKTPNSQLVTPISIKLQRPDGSD
jgi:hypothetical protein